MHGIPGFRHRVEAGGQMGSLHGPAAPVSGRSFLSSGPLPHESIHESRLLKSIHESGSTGDCSSTVQAWVDPTEHVLWKPSVQLVHLTQRSRCCSTCGR